MRMQQHPLSVAERHEPWPTAPHSPALRTSPPPISPGIARTTSPPIKVATPAERATEALLTPSHPPYPRALLSRSLVLTAHAAARLSYVLRGGSVPQVGLYGKVILVTVLVLRYAHHFPHPARHHLTIPGLYSTPPLNPSIRPYLPPTYDPPGPDLVAMWTAGDVAGSIPHLLIQADTLSAPVCGSADAQDALFSVQVRGAWVGPTVGRSSERVVVSVIVYNG